MEAAEVVVMSVVAAVGSRGSWVVLVAASSTEAIAAHRCRAPASSFNSSLPSLCIFLHVIYIVYTYAKQPTTYLPACLPALPACLSTYLRTLHAMATPAEPSFQKQGTVLDPITGLPPGWRRREFFENELGETADSINELMKLVCDRTGEHVEQLTQQRAIRNTKARTSGEPGAKGPSEKSSPKRSNSSGGKLGRMGASGEEVQDRNQGWQDIPPLPEGRW